MRFEQRSYLLILGIKILESLKHRKDVIKDYKN